jgi:hypothetical protein
VWKGETEFVSFSVCISYTKLMVYLSSRLVHTGMLVMFAVMGVSVLVKTEVILRTCHWYAECIPQCLH